MAKKKKPIIKMKCEECKRVNYHTQKSKKMFTEAKAKLELKKYCKWCRKHIMHKESKR